MTGWQPDASTQMLATRAAMLAAIRRFFAERGVLEVETPLLAATTATDPHIQSLKVSNSYLGSAQEFFLQSSPEFAMKRLLAAGSGSIYQICKAFRQDEKSQRHNPEFTLLEWYRTGFTMEDLMGEVEQLVADVHTTVKIERISYAAMFERVLGYNPHAADLETLLVSVQTNIDIAATTLSADDCLFLLWTHVIEPDLPANCFIYDYPASQAALARIEVDSQGHLVGRRFELFINGMEIANGYHELTDASQQRQRFMADNLKRQVMGLEVYPLDEKLLAAMEQGLPECAGVALGLDRLLMVVTKAKRISQVLAFSTDSPGA